MISGMIRNHYKILKIKTFSESSVVAELPTQLTSPSNGSPGHGFFLKTFIGHIIVMMERLLIQVL